MIIDSFTAAAQALNFLILAYILYRVLFKRIVRVIDERNNGIRARLEEAEETKKSAEEEKRKQTELNGNMEKDRGKILERAEQEAENTRKELVRKAREEAEKMKDDWIKSLENEKKASLDAVKKTVLDGITSGLRNALAGLAAEDCQPLITKKFIEKLKSMARDETHKIRESVRSGQGKVCVATAAAADDGTRKKLTDAVSGIAGEKTEISFETDRGLVSGIELRTDNYILGLTLNDYISGYGEKLSSALDSAVREGKAENNE